MRCFEVSPGSVILSVPFPYSSNLRDVDSIGGRALVVWGEAWITVGDAKPMFDVIKRRFQSKEGRIG